MIEAVERQLLVEALAIVYAESVDAAVLIAKLCDDHLDRSGRLLGDVRSRARVDREAVLPGGER